MPARFDSPFNSPTRSSAESDQPFHSLSSSLHESDGAEDNIGDYLENDSSR